MKGLGRQSWNCLYKTVGNICLQLRRDGEKETEKEDWLTGETAHRPITDSQSWGDVEIITS